MTSCVPKSDYRVRDANELDDLVLWSKSNCANKFLANVGFRIALRDFLNQFASTKYFAGPLDRQAEFDPAIIVPAGLPVIVHITFGREEVDKAFLYLTDTTTEFHVSEKYCVTGNLVEDQSRRDRICGLADGLRSLMGAEWVFAEYGGITITIDTLNHFWAQYWENLFERVDFELDAVESE